MVPKAHSDHLANCTNHTFLICNAQVFWLSTMAKVSLDRDVFNIEWLSTSLKVSL